MRVLEALKILEEATLNSPLMSIDTPEVREALDVVDPHCAPKWRVQAFRDHLEPGGRRPVDLEGQQQNLRALYGGIHDNIRQLLSNQIATLQHGYKNSNSPAVKVEIDRLSAELAKLPEQWKFVPR